MSLNFPSDHFVYDPASSSIRFTAIAGLVEMIPCVVGEQTLLDLQHSEFGGRDIIPIFLRHRGVIEVAAKDKFRHGRLEKDGTIRVNGSDLGI